MKLSDKWYNFLKWVVVIALPAFSAAIFSLGQLLEWSAAGIVVGILAIVTTLLGTLIGVSTREFNKTA